jgi:galactokinase
MKGMRTGAGEVGVEERALGPLLEHAAAFEARFGPSRGAIRAFFSPGRVNLMGAHLDYSGGPVMPTAIDRGTFIALRPRPGPRIRLASTLDPEAFEFDLERLPAARLGRWVDYPLGVLAALVRRARDARALGGCELLFGGNLPVGAGLSSSASICVGTAFALDRLWNLGLEPLELVDVALEAERGFVGVQCGIMDPYAVGLARPGHLLWLDCADRSWEHLPFDGSRVQIAVADSGVRRELAQVAFNERVRESAAAFEALRPYAPGARCLRDVPPAVLEAHRSELDPILARRAQHVLDEVGRTCAAREALLAGDLATLGALMTRTHDSLRDLYEVSVPELDQLVASARSVPGVLGARLTGAGFGGCVVVLLERGTAGALRTVLERDFRARFGRVPGFEVFAGDSGPREIDLARAR